MALTVVIAEDSLLMREGIRSVLALDDEIAVFDICGDYESLIAAADTNEPDAVITDIRSQLERQLSTQIMREGKKPKFRKLAQGETLVDQGDPGNELFLLLDGVLTVEMGGEAVAEVGPGSILGERALVEDSRRTSTLRAATPARVAVAIASEIQPKALRELASHHHREDASPPRIG